MSAATFGFLIGGAITIAVIIWLAYNPGPHCAIAWCFEVRR